MSVLNYFKNTPGRPAIGRQALVKKIFSSNLQRGPWKKRGACRPPNERQGPVPLSHRMPPFPLSFEPKNSGKKPALAAIPFVI